MEHWKRDEVVKGYLYSCLHDSAQAFAKDINVLWAIKTNCKMAAVCPSYSTLDSHGCLTGVLERRTWMVESDTNPTKYLVTHGFKPNVCYTVFKVFSNLKAR